jgi:hypothetical protein
MVWNRQFGTPSVSPSPVSPATLPLVAVCIPYMVDVTMLWAYKMLTPLMGIPNPACSKTLKMVRGIPVSVARDEIVRLCLEDPNITHLLWVDTDNICQKPQDPNIALQQLLACNVPIVSGLYRAKQKEGFNWAAWMDAHLPDKIGFTPVQSWNGNFFQVDTVGFGFVLVKREVFEKIPAPWFEWASPAPSEDFNFCIKARKHGYVINVFADIQLDHKGELTVHPDGTITTLDI